jgi:hypothetical protein
VAADFAGCTAATSFDGLAAPVVVVPLRSATIGIIGRSVVATTGSLPTGAMPRRGQAKSSARPACARDRSLGRRCR